MSKRTAFSRKSEQRHWHLRHEHEEAERQQKRVQKFQRKAGIKQGHDVRATHEENRPDRESDAPGDLY